MAELPSPNFDENLTADRESDELCFPPPANLHFDILVKLRIFQDLYFCAGNQSKLLEVS